MVSVASKVCSVLTTRWPVSAAERAIRELSESHVSPMRMTSGGLTKDALQARAYEAASARTSRWLMMHQSSWWSSAY